MLTFAKIQQLTSMLRSFQNRFENLLRGLRHRMQKFVGKMGADVDIASVTSFKPPVTRSQVTGY